MRRFILPTLLFLLSLGLLVFARMNVPEQGQITSLTTGTTVHRGQELKTEANERQQYQIATREIKTLFWLDAKTTLTLLDASAVPTLALREGRVVISGPAKIMIRNTVIENTGTVSLVFYSWQDKLDVAYPETGESYTLDTLHPEKPKTELKFDPKNSSAAVFYSWALGGAIK